MFSFLVKRLFQALIVMFVISLVAFAIQDNLGDPLRELVGQSVSEAERQQLRDDLGLNDPFVTKYSRFLGNAVQGDLGRDQPDGDSMQDSPGPFAISGLSDLEKSRHPLSNTLHIPKGLPSRRKGRSLP